MQHNAAWDLPLAAMPPRCPDRRPQGKSQGQHPGLRLTSGSAIGRMPGLPWLTLPLVLLPQRGRVSGHAHVPQIPSVPAALLDKGASSKAVPPSVQQSCGVSKGRRCIVKGPLRKAAARANLEACGGPWAAVRMGELSVVQGGVGLLCRG